MAAAIRSNQLTNKQYCLATLGLCIGLAEELRCEALSLRQYRWVPALDSADFDALAQPCPLLLGRVENGSQKQCHRTGGPWHHLGSQPKRVYLVHLLGLSRCESQCPGLRHWAIFYSTKLVKKLIWVGVIVPEDVLITVIALVLVLFR